MRKNVSPFMRKTLEEMGVPVESPGPLFAPMLSNTVSPTILRAGYKDNVIPGEATIVLDGRTLPGEDPESFIRRLPAELGEDRVHLHGTRTGSCSRCPQGGPT